MADKKVNPLAEFLLSESAEATIINGDRSFEDDRIWSLKKKVGMDATSAIIRFLPTPKSISPFLTVYTHRAGFGTDKGEWFQYDCLHNYGKGEKEPCPICEHVWASYDKYGQTFNEEIKKNVSAMPKRHKEFFAQKECWVNIYVVEDNTEPANNGKVFLYNIKPAIMSKIKAALDPKKSIKKGDRYNCFKIDDTGSNFEIVYNYAKNATGAEYYESSSVIKEREFLGGSVENAIAIMKQLHPLNSLTDIYPDRDKAPTYDELLKLYTSRGESRRITGVPFAPVDEILTKNLSKTTEAEELIKSEAAKGPKKSQNRETKVEYEDDLVAEDRENLDDGDGDDEFPF